MMFFFKNLTTLVVVIFFNAHLFAQSPEELMNRANKYYQEGQFEQAIQTYEKILSQGFESGALYYNLGNTYFRTGKLGNAIFNYEKGLKLEPNDEDLLYNLRIANSRTIDKITEVPKLFIISWWEGLVTSFSVSGWSVFVIIVFLFFLASIAGYLFIRRTRIQRLAFLSGSILLSVLIIISVLLFARIGRESSTNYGVLFSAAYSVKVSPDSKSNDAFIVHEGIKFSLVDQVNDWVKVRLVDGKVGWIQKDAFGQI